MHTHVPSSTEPIEKKQSRRGIRLVLIVLSLVVGAAGAMAWCALDSFITLPIL